MSRSRAVLILTLLAVLPVPAAASAAEGFAGILENGTLVRFQSDAPTGLSLPVHIRGLAPRDQVVALGSGGGRVFAVGSSARLYQLDVRGARARAIGTVFPEGLRGRRFSLVVTADGRQARLLSDVGQDVFVDTATGATLPGPALRRADNGQPAFPAAALAPDGRLVGVDIVRQELMRETEPGSSLLTVAPLKTERGITFAEPAGVSILPDGRAWVLAAFGSRNRIRQSGLLELDVAGSKTQGYFRPFLRRVNTVAPVGPVPDDTKAPNARIRMARTLSLKDLLNHRLKVKIDVSEGGQTLASLRIGGTGANGGEIVGFGLTSRDTPGTVTFRDWSVNGKDRVTLRRAVGRKIRLALSIHDWKNNKKTILRSFRLTK